MTIDKETLGRLVRDEWVAWCRERAASGETVPAHHLAPWEDVPESVREVDRRIGARIARAVTGGDQ